MKPNLWRALGVLGFFSASCLTAMACDDGDDGGAGASTSSTGGSGGASPGSGGNGGETPGVGGSGGETPGAGGAGGAGGGASACANDDMYEDNDVAMTATPVPVPPPDPGNPDWFVDASVDAYKCSSDDDWYFVKTSFSVMGNDPPDTRYWTLVLQAAGAGSCGASCDDVVPPAGPQSTVTVEVYDATSMALLGTETSDVGLVRIEGYGAAFANDVVFRVSGPPEAVYEYEFRTTVRSDAFEDECEC